MQEEFNYMQSGMWAERNPFTCPCKGTGWTLSDLDTWHECPVHKHGRPHPEAEGEMFAATDNDPVGFDAEHEYMLAVSRRRLEMYRRLYRDARAASRKAGFTDNFKDACTGLLHDQEFLSRFGIAEDAKITPAMWVAAAEEVAENAHVNRQAEETDYPF